MGKGYAPLIVLVLLTTIPLGVVCVQPVKAQTLSAITINADGTVVPSEAPIEQIGNLYALTSDFVGSITVNKNNIVIAGKNYALSGGLLIQGVSNVTVEEFVVTDGEEFSSNEVDGILLDHASQVTVTNNAISGIWSIWELNGVGFSGIDIYSGSSNVITGNSLLENANSIIFQETQKNLIVNNTFVNSKINNTFAFSMINFWDASNNTVYHNNFIATYGMLANDGDYENPGSINVWDNGYPDGGNYWANYASYGAKEIELSGIGNKPYIIDTKNSDRYPFMEPFNTTFYAMQIMQPEISLLSPLNRTYNNSSVSLNFTINVLSPVKAVNWTGYSLDDKQNVTINGNTTLTGLTSGSHSITIYANDSYGNMGASESVSFTIPEPFPTVTVVSISSVILVVVVLAGLSVYFKKHKRLTS